MKISDNVADGMGNLHI